MIVAALVIAAYLIGAFPTSYIVGRLTRGIDLREHGSGNLGATNTYRVLGRRAAIPVFIIDIFKGWLPTALFPLWDGSNVPELAIAYGRQRSRSTDDRTEVPINGRLDHDT